MDAQLVIEKGSSRPQTFRLQGLETTIGRHEGCGVRIPSAKVSRRHCRLTLDGGILHVEDLGSSNGTFLNGQRVRAAEVVHPGDRLEVGPVTFRVQYQLSEAARERLLRLEQQGEGVPEFDVEEVADLEEVTEYEVPAAPAVEEAAEAAEADSDTFQFAVTGADEPAPTDTGPSEDVEVAVDDDDIFVRGDDSGHRPTGQDLREILSRLDEE